MKQVETNAVFILYTYVIRQFILVTVGNCWSVEVPCFRHHLNIKRASTSPWHPANSTGSPDYITMSPVFPHKIGNPGYTKPTSSLSNGGPRDRQTMFFSCHPGIWLGSFSWTVIWRQSWGQMQRSWLLFVLQTSTSVPPWLDVDLCLSHPSDSSHSCNSYRLQHLVCPRCFCSCVLYICKPWFLPISYRCHTRHLAGVKRLCKPSSLYFFMATLYDWDQVHVIRNKTHFHGFLYCGWWQYCLVPWPGEWGHRQDTP